MTPSANTLRQRLAAVIGGHRDEIVERWLDIVRADERASGVPLTELRDALPDYLDAIRCELAEDGESDDQGGGAAWRQVAQEHALTRVRLGFDIGQLVREFIVLRRVLHEAAERRGVSEEPAAKIIAELLEAAIAVAVQSYVEARDYASRRTQAANVAFITHELRNPLNAAILAAERIEGQAPGGLERVVAILSRNLGRMRELIDDVLDSARIQADDVHCRPAKTTLADLVSEAVGTAKDAANRKGLEFNAAFDPDLEVEVDPVLTRSALQNLLDNAVKYTASGSIDLAIDAQGGQLAFHVRDSCDGISDEELSTIFEPFQRGRTRESGSGLGLAIARRAIALQGGNLKAESPGPCGCHFWITMPKDVHCEQPEEDEEGPSFTDGSRAPEIARRQRG